MPKFDAAAAVLVKHALHRPQISVKPVRENRFHYPYTSANRMPGVCVNKYAHVFQSSTSLVTKPWPLMFLGQRRGHLRDADGLANSQLTAITTYSPLHQSRLRGLRMSNAPGDQNDRADRHVVKRRARQLGLGY